MTGFDTVPRSAEPLVLYEKQEGIATITLNRPAALNAINLAMRDLLWEMLQAVRDDPDVRVLIIRGAGERAFSAGADIKEFGTAPSYIAARDARRRRDLWALLLHLPKPVIAAIHGFAYGAGCEMSLCCDLRIASEAARFALPEVTLGYIPSAGGTQLLPRIIPPGAARAMILSGEAIGAAEALRLGLVQRVVPADQVMSDSFALADRLSHRSPVVLSYAKEAITAGLDLPLWQGLALEARMARLALVASRPPHDE
ncbi:MAG: enoyl-CoA hydratase/isomerase family protein [Dehalococcoidia bacterium]